MSRVAVPLARFSPLPPPPDLPGSSAQRLIYMPPNSATMPVGPTPTPTGPSPTSPGRSATPHSAGTASGLTSYISSRFETAFQYRKNILRLRGPGFPSLGLFCSTCTPPPEILSTTILASPAPPAPPEVKSPVFVRMAERGQAEAVRGFFGKLPPETKASEAIEGLAKYLNDGKESPKAANPARPRVELTISQLLTLPGEWERVQYLAIFFVLHSQDVKFVDTNEFENLLRDIELGKLTQTAVSGISGTASAGVGNAPPSTTTISRPGNISITADMKYTEALERQLKEQLQFRASSLDLDGRILCVVLKSSQQNKLPTLIRPVVTLQYQGSLDKQSRGVILRPEYQQGKLIALSFQDLVLRQKQQMAETDQNEGDVDIWKTQATPVVVGVVRRVRNAKGVNTSLEDDDDVEYVTQAKVLDPVTLDAPSKCEYRINVRTNAYSVFVLGPGDPLAKQARFVEQDAAERFAFMLKERLAAGTSLGDGLMFDAPIALAGLRLVFGIDPRNVTKDWTGLKASDVFVSQPSCK